ncbi:MAG: 50S ribosomal protein L1 [Candidatus Nitrosotenuis sp.]
MRKNIRKERRSPRYQTARAEGDRLTLHDAATALALVKKTATAKFPETIDMAIRLGIDPKQSDQNVRGTTLLPHGTGKSRTVAVLARGAQADAAKAAGADVVGDDDLVAKIAEGFKNFDVLVAAQEMAPVLSKIGKVLGPKTPNKKSGTLTDDPGKAVSEIKQASRVEYRNDKAGIIHMPIGKVNFPDDHLMENFLAALGAILRAKPTTAKGKYLVSITLSSTMGPGFRVDPITATKAAGV